MSDDDLDKFRRFAGECLRLVERFQSVDDRAVLLSMAQVWIRLADQGQKKTPANRRGRRAAAARFALTRELSTAARGTVVPRTLSRPNLQMSSLSRQP
jgi:hypothetical protein